MRIKPDIIPAPEWAFYYPDRATLVVVKFPQGYHDVLRDLIRLRSPAAQSCVIRN